VWDQKTGSIKEAHTKGIDPALVGEFRSPEGRTLKTGMQLLIERVMNEYTPEKAAHICGIPAETIERIALEMGITARDETISLPIPWTDAWGDEHKTTTGNPVSVHAMRGIAAHSNGFQTGRWESSTGREASGTSPLTQGRSLPVPSRSILLQK
jgi:anaerobic selenocysteine-containing dehydrogenase